jgi:hypothetical protein
VIESDRELEISDERLFNERREGMKLQQGKAGQRGDYKRREAA